MNIQPAIVIPAYNPDDKLITLLEALAPSFPLILVVDDGSTSGQTVFDRLPAGISLIRHAVNCGKGRALKTGINALLTAHPTLPAIITADADGQHTPADIAKIAAALADNPTTLILGTRAFTGPVPFRSRFGNGMTTFLFSIFTGLYVRDTQTGLRGIPASFLRTCLLLPGERYEYEMNMLASAASMQPKPLQIPIETIYIEENRSSHFNPIKDSFRICRVLFHFLLASFLAFIVDTIIFMIIAGCGGGLALCTGGARLISGTFNFFYNKKLIFRPGAGSIPYFFTAYWLLVIILGIAAWGGIKFLNAYTDFPLLADKIIVESILFLVSFFAQKHIVFKPSK